jgi:hypothetical protein
VWPLGRRCGSAGRRSIPRPAGREQPRLGRSGRAASKGRCCTYLGCLTVEGVKARRAAVGCVRRCPGRFPGCLGGGGADRISLSHGSRQAHRRLRDEYRRGRAAEVDAEPRRDGYPAWSPDGRWMPSIANVTATPASTS